VSAAGATEPSLNLATVFLDRNADEERGGRTALVGPAGSVTYAELSELSNRVGNALLEIGVRAHERVLLALADSPAFVATWYAVQKIGAVTAEVYTFLQPKDYTYYLDYTGAAVVVVDGVTLDRMREASTAARVRPTLLVVDARETALRAGEVSFESLVSRQPAELQAAPTARRGGIRHGAPRRFRWRPRRARRGGQNRAPHARNRRRRRRSSCAHAATLSR